MVWSDIIWSGNKKKTPVNTEVFVVRWIRLNSDIVTTMGSEPILKRVVFTGVYSALNSVGVRIGVFVRFEV